MKSLEKRGTKKTNGVSLPKSPTNMMWLPLQREHDDESHSLSVHTKIMRGCTDIIRKDSKFMQGKLKYQVPGTWICKGTDVPKRYRATDGVMQYDAFYMVAVLYFDDSPVEIAL